MCVLSGSVLREKEYNAYYSICWSYATVILPCHLIFSYLWSTCFVPQTYQKNKLSLNFSAGGAGVFGTGHAIQNQTSPSKMNEMSPLMKPQFRERDVKVIFFINSVLSGLYLFFWFSPLSFCFVFFCLCAFLFCLELCVFVVL